jgi:hypothetical protein
MLFSAVALVGAAETASSAIDGVTTTVDVTYVTKYIWRGFNIFGSHGAVQPSIDFAFENGFSANVWMSYPVGSGQVGVVNGEGIGINDELTEYDYTLAYSNTAYEDCPWKTDYTVGWRYYDFIDVATKEADMQEVFAEISMPVLIGNGIVPRAGIYQMWNSESGGANSGAAGTIYAMGFGYDFNLDQAPELPMNFSWDIVYNDGTGASTVDHDWSHMVWGLSTSMTCPATGGTIAPAIYFQNSFESTVNDDDELWAGISYSLSF